MMIFYLLQKYKSTSVITEPAYFLLAQIWATEFLLGGGGGGGFKYLQKQDKTNCLTSC